MQEAIEPQNNNIKTKEHPDLYRKSIKGGYWVIAMRVVLFVLGFAKSIIIANFFILENLGLIAVAAMMMEILSTFTQTGFETALIQKKGDVEDYLDTAWTAGVIKGVFLFLVLYTAAPLVASIRVPEDKVPLAVGILRAMSVCFLISGIRNIGTIFFQKELDFRKVFTLNVVTTLTNIILSLSLMYILKSIWGIIIAQIIAAIVSSLGSYILSPYRPRLHFEPAKARELWRFGKWIYGQTLLCYALQMGDNFFVWLSLGLPQLALYKNAYNFANMPATEIGSAIAAVSFPVYSKIQDDIPRLREAYLKTLKFTTFVTIPISFAIFILGPDFVKLVLKEHLYPMIPALQILAFVGLIASTGAASGAFLTALRKLHTITFLLSLRLCFLIAMIYPFTTRWGIEGTAVSVLSSQLLMYPIGLFFACKYLKCRPWKILENYVYPVLASLCMYLVIAAVRSHLLTDTTIFNFLVMGAIGCGIYVSIAWAMDTVLSLGVRTIVNDQLKVLKMR